MRKVTTVQHDIALLINCGLAHFQFGNRSTHYATVPLLALVPGSIKSVSVHFSKKHDSIDFVRRRDVLSLLLWLRTISTELHLLYATVPYPATHLIVIENFWLFFFS